MRTEEFKSLPKVELHLHLDCSLSYDVVHAIDPSISREEYQTNFIAPAKCSGLVEYINKALNSIALMQTREHLQLITEDLFKQLAEDNVIYAEIRFAPLEHTLMGLSPFEVVDIVHAQTSKCIKKYGVHAGIILCTLRHYSEEQSLATAKLVEQFKGTSVVGFDIAADEGGFPIDKHVRAFNYAFNNNINCTAHAGEAKGPESIRETIKNFKVTRIGHGVRSIEDQELVDYLVANNIHLEICPTSNIQVDVFDRIENHSINALYNAGVSLSVNTDARTISNVSLSEEYSLLMDTFGWTKSHFKKTNMEAIKHAFCSQSLKNELTDTILSSY